MIEWKYLIYLNKVDGYIPKNIWNELSTNTAFFIDALKNVCGKNNRFRNDKNLGLKMLEQSYRLLDGWKKLPGLLDNGEVDYTKLDDLHLNVFKYSKTLEIEKNAMIYFGKVIFHTPKDRNGFFIDEIVVKCLQNDKNGYIRLGYSIEAYNSRGIHYVDPTGKDEFAI